MKFILPKYKKDAFLRLLFYLNLILPTFTIPVILTSQATFLINHQVRTTA